MLRLEIITVEGAQFDEDVSMVIAPGSEGVLGILPHHTPLITTLTYGELDIKKEGQPDQFFAIGGGFMEVRPDHVIVMADSAERVEEIDTDRAEAARRRAEDILSRQDEQFDFSQAEAALRRSAARLKVAQRRGYARDRHRPPPSDLSSG